jgi:hypothetical protein
MRPDRCQSAGNGNFADVDCIREDSLKVIQAVGQRGAHGRVKRKR